MATWEEVVADGPKVFCAHCAVKDDCHPSRDKFMWPNQWACNRERESLVLVGLCPDGVSWVDFVTRETNGVVTGDFRVWPRE